MVLGGHFLLLMLPAHLLLMMLRTHLLLVMLSGHLLLMMLAAIHPCCMLSDSSLLVHPILTVAPSCWTPLLWARPGFPQRCDCCREDFLPRVCSP